MKILGIVVVLLLMMVFTAKAQYPANNAPGDTQTGPITAPAFTDQRPDTLSRTTGWNHLTINSDSTIHLLLDIKKEESLRKGGIDGYRVQIYQGPKDGADRIYSRFLASFPDYKIYKSFPGPDFKVRVGDFRDRSEAIYLKHLIEKDFPNPLIVEDVINFPELKRKSETTKMYE
ncbi:MAG: SPOR domain-containing protein [Prolixibacteraceae bacterium]|nr:SPOR domain-containing protein [Prolixibacteraceae bacterium]